MLIYINIILQVKIYKKQKTIQTGSLLPLATRYTLKFSGLPQSGKNIWKMKNFPGQGKVREFCGWPGKFRKDLESQGKVREFENKRLQKIYLFCSIGEKIYFFMR